jgi:hypothetical protein|tara:strand:+ start:6324 stop:6710 length:387 start_codon:yes stop_codon:yes gene_type:complete
MTQQETLNKIFKDNGLIAEDVFKHQHYTIITRAGIDKIQANKGIDISYNLERCEPTFAVVKAYATLGDTKIETFGSALKGNSFKDGSTNTYYVVEMAEKRAMSRAVLKLAGLYSLGVFGEDESESFKK